MICHDCTIKHLSACLVLVDECTHHEDDYYRLIGHLVEAEHHCGDKATAEKIRALRHDMPSVSYDRIYTVLTDCLGEDDEDDTLI